MSRNRKGLSGLGAGRTPVRLKVTEGGTGQCQSHRNGLGINGGGPYGPWQGFCTSPECRGKSVRITDRERVRHSSHFKELML